MRLFAPYIALNLLAPLRSGPPILLSTNTDATTFNFSGNDTSAGEYTLVMVPTLNANQVDPYGSVTISNWTLGSTSPIWTDVRGAPLSDNTSARFVIGVAIFPTGGNSQTLYLEYTNTQRYCLPALWPLNNFTEVVGTAHDVDSSVSSDSTTNASFSDVTEVEGCFFTAQGFPNPSNNGSLSDFRRDASIFEQGGDNDIINRDSLPGVRTGTVNCNIRASGGTSSSRSHSLGIRIK